MKDAFTIEKVRSFVAAWYRLLDIHAPVKECFSMLADETLSMQFPDGRICDYATFSKWYYRVINTFFDEHHIVNNIEIPEIANDQAKVDVLVSWQASFWEPPAAKSKRVALDAAQRWIIRHSKKNAFGFEIVYYNAEAKRLKYAPGYARLGENQQIPDRLFFPAGARKYRDPDKTNMCYDGFIEDLQGSPKSPSLRALYAKFTDGAHTKWHYHTGDQMLLAKEGQGFVEIHGHQIYTIGCNDRVLIPAGVWHRHGAVEKENANHLAVTIGRTVWNEDDPCEDHPHAD